MRPGTLPQGVPTEPFGTSRNTLRLIEACVLGNVPALRSLLASGADPNALTSCGYSPLHFAALAGRAASVQALLEAGADPLHRGPSALLAVDLAAMQGATEALALLRAATRAARRLRQEDRVQPACLARADTPLIPTLAAA